MQTRRRFLSFIASLLTLADAVRRFFKPPEVVEDRGIRAGTEFYGTRFWADLERTREARPGEPVAVIECFGLPMIEQAHVARRPILRETCNGNRFACFDLPLDG